LRIIRPKADRQLSLRVFGCLPNTVVGAPIAGVRKASKEETAGELATALMRAYEDLGTAAEGFSM
jgi:predicted nucleotide-binding protein (sugar kinase/HSP70/actin superfamily)